MRTAVGNAARVRVHPNFAAVSRTAWLAGDRRLAEIGMKSYPTRGAGSDFKQPAEYRQGDAILDIGWKASDRQGRPIVRQYQDERDQSVVFLLNCGRRMRADESDDPCAGAEGTRGASRGSHFDAALDALMLPAYVVLKEGDEGGAMTFGRLQRRAAAHASRLARGGERADEKAARAVAGQAGRMVVAGLSPPA